MTKLKTIIKENFILIVVSLLLLVALILECLPASLEMHFQNSPDPNDIIIHHYPYYSLLPMGYGMFYAMSSFVFTILTIIIILAYWIFKRKFLLILGSFFLLIPVIVSFIFIEYVNINSFFIIILGLIIVAIIGLISLFLLQIKKTPTEKSQMSNVN